MTFLAPLLLGGLALGSVPIIIHLLNRRRFVLIDWAPMKYLKLTLKSNRRRLRLEQWLLLAVRTLAVLLLFFAVARPVISQSGLGGWFAGRTRTSRVVVVDDTLSMGLHASGNGVVMDRARDAAVKLIEAIGTQDSLTLVTTSSPDSPLIRHAHIEDPAELAATLRELPVKHTANDWAATFDAVKTHLESAEFPIKQVTLITDLRSQGWGPQVTEQARHWAEQDVTLTVIDVGEQAKSNVALVEFKQQDPVTLAGLPLRLMALVRNDGPETIAAPQAVLSVDGVEQTVVMPDLPAGKSVEVPVTVTLDGAGMHSLSFATPDDALPLDNRRWLTVDARKRVAATLVDGQPGSRPFESETDFMALALKVGRSPWRVRLMDDSQWLASPMTAPDVLVLANVASIPASRAAELERMVRDGMGLIVFPGDQTDAHDYDRLVINNEGGLLPARMLRVADDPATGLLLDPLADSPLTSIRILPAETLASIRPKQYAELALAPKLDDGRGRRVLATWDNASQSPAVVEARIGKGRVLQWSISADRAWSDWPIDPSFVLAMRESALALAGQPDPGLVLTAGQAIRQRFDPQLAPQTVSLSTPEAPDPLSLPVSKTNGDQAQAPEITYTRTLTAGAYEMKWSEPGRDTQATLISVNPDPRESDLATLSIERLNTFLAGLDAVVIPYGQAGELTDAKSAELWRQIVYALLAMIGIETLLAAWVTRDH